MKGARSATPVAQAAEGFCAQITSYEQESGVQADSTRTVRIICAHSLLSVCDLNDCRKVGKGCTTESVCFRQLRLARIKRMRSIYALSFLELVLFAAPSWAAEPEPMFSLPEVRLNRLQHMALTEDIGPEEDLYLYAPDEDTHIVEQGEQFCGADERDTKSTGHYYLIVATGDHVLSQVSLGRDMFFVDEKDWSGMEYFRLKHTNQVYVRILQYAGCRLGGGGSSYLFAIKHGQIHPVRFLTRDGKRSNSVLELHAGNDGTVTSTEWAEPLGEGLIQRTYRKGNDPNDYDFYELRTLIRPDSPVGR